MSRFLWVTISEVVAIVWMGVSCNVAAITRGMRRYIYGIYMSWIRFEFEGLLRPSVSRVSLEKEGTKVCAGMVPLIIFGMCLIIPK